MKQERFTVFEIVNEARKEICLGFQKIVKKITAKRARHGSSEDIQYYSLHSGI